METFCYRRRSVMETFCTVRFCMERFCRGDVSYVATKFYIHSVRIYIQHGATIKDAHGLEDIQYTCTVSGFYIFDGSTHATVY
jgi:hypothetical protein